MPAEDLLQRLHDALAPATGARERIAMRLQARITAPSILRQTRAALTPAPEAKHLIWERIASRLTAARAYGVLTGLRSWMDSADEARRTLWRPVAECLVPVRRTARVFQGLKWAAAFLLIAFVVQLTPRILWAPQTVAESRMIVLPTNGQVYVLMDELWQPIQDELLLRPGMQLRTGDGQASLVLGDNGVLRLDKDTTVQIVDLSDRSEPASELMPTITLTSGRLWLQGLVPAHLRGITVAAGDSLVTVHEGSVSIQWGETLIVEDFDRRSAVTRAGHTAVLVTGDRVQLSANTPFVVKHVSDERFHDAWVRENLARDAVHRQEIAMLQQARLAERAGILPTSTFYPVKRVVEAVDLFLTLGEEARMQKQISFADNRLTEAAALLARGQTGAVTLSLAEYRGTLVALASGSGDATLAQFLLRQSVAQDASEVAASLPGDRGYLIKKVVLETSNALSGGVVKEGEAQGSMLLDTLAVLTQTVESGNVSGVSATWGELKPQLKLLALSDASLTPEARKEAKAALGMLALSLEKLSAEGTVDTLDPAVRQEIAAYLPADETVPSLSESDIQTIVSSIKDRIFLYHFMQPRVNQFTMEMRALEGHSDQGRILRRLYFALPDGPEKFPERVRQEILKLQWRKAGER